MLNLTGDLLQCPYCRHDLQIPESVWFYYCDNCHENLDLKAQFAYQRGLEAFDEGQELMVDKGPRKTRSKTREHAIYRQVLDLFTEAYSALQVAFTGRLEEIQRQVGVEMMASMTAEFFQQNMVSPLETNYWNLVLREQKARMEIDSIKLQLGQPGGSVGWFTRIRGTLRVRQLKGKLPELDEKIRFVEKQIDFVDPPRSRNKNWKP